MSDSKKTMSMVFGCLLVAFSLPSFPLMAQDVPSRPDLTGGKTGAGPLQGTMESVVAQGEGAEQLSNSFNVGDAYLTPQGARELRRLAGAVAVQIETGANKAGVLSQLRGQGGPLAEYTVEAEYIDDIVVLKASDAERDRHFAQASALEDSINSAAGIPGVRWAHPVFVDSKTGLWEIATDEIIVQLSADTDPAFYFGQQYADVRRPPATKRLFVLELPGAGVEEVLAEVNAMAGDAGVEWAEPNFLAQGILHAPNDPYYPQQWHLNNTGQGGGTPGADVDAQAAWTTTTGSSDVLVAILDVGTQTNHPDLGPNLWSNPGETAGNGVDDDANGYTDDVNGWDFYTGWSPGNNNPNPKVSYDNHGTATAGVAVARGNNSIGVASAAYTSRLLPLRVGESSSGGTYSYYTSGMAAAIRYAAGVDDTGAHIWRGADVLSISLGIGDYTVINNAFSDASSNGRDGKGCPIFVSSGNSASGYAQFTLTGITAGSWYFEWTYTKNASGSAGDDTCWVAYVELPDGSVERFDSPSMPAGWDASPWGNPSWYIENDPAHAYGTGRYQARAASIGDNMMTDLRSKTVTVGTTSQLRFKYWISSQSGLDGIQLWAYKSGTGWYGPFLNTSGVPSITASVGYPASRSDTIAVGASTNFDYRSNYSQYGSTLDFVAPSSGGTLGIYTTDRTGSDGYDSGDYYSSFGGTSSACPLAAGVGALVLSKNPSLTASEVRTIMRNSCDQIGGVSYVGGFNTYYGYGRVNAYGALQLTPELCDPPTANCCTGLSFALNGNSVTIDASDIDCLSTAGGTCSLTTWEIKKTGEPDENYGSTVTFYCSDLGSQSVTLRVTQDDEQTDVCSTIVMIADNTPPSVTCKNAIVQLDAAGQVCIIPADVFDSGSDNCGTVNLVSVVPACFDCTDIGPNTVTLTVNDGNGNENTCQATVTVEDKTPPDITCPGNVTVECDESTAPSSTGTATATDNCTAVEDILITYEDSVDGAEITRTWTAEDLCGNTSSCSQTITMDVPIVLEWRSMKFHGDQCGWLGIVLDPSKDGPDDATTESRFEGLVEIRVEFDRDITDCFTPNRVEIAGGLTVDGIDELTPDGKTLIIPLTGSTNQSCYLIDISASVAGLLISDADCYVATLEGDTNDDHKTDALDRGQVKVSELAGDPATLYPRRDVNLDCKIDALDRGAVKVRELALHEVVCP